MFIASSFVLVTGLAVVGAWLESIGGKDGFMDWFLTPFPLGLSGLCIAFLEVSF